VFTVVMHVFFRMHVCMLTVIDILPREINRQ
jgi:hypothetical protein